ncbi:MAG: nitronate monooxygenase [Thermaerobacter sp.]|nr:nitronate monooxygenase [Thermaerobacter sp.]
MGVAVSHWPLARAVSVAGHLGVVSGTGIDTVIVRRLQDGDAGGHIRRALASSPWSGLADQLLARYFLPAGKPDEQPYARLPMWTLSATAWRKAVAMLSGYVEVWLAKHGHGGPVGINLLTKVPLPNLAVLYGAMHAGVDVVLMGAGIPREIPGALDRMARHEAAQLRLEVVGARPTDPEQWMHFDPQTYASGVTEPLQRPAFFPIVAAHSLAHMMAKKASGAIQGFIIEGPTAGGHNAPPRGAKTVDESGQPVYGERDVVDLGEIAKLGYPYWLAGSFGFRGSLAAAQALGATGIQVGTLFAYCQESGLTEAVRKKVLEQVKAGHLTIRTDPLASPTGFPFKVVELKETLSEESVYLERRRVCDLGYLREAYREQSGRIGYRCAAEPLRDYVAKGGEVEETEGRKCLCNGLMASAGVPQRQKDGSVELPIVTSGDEILRIRELIGERDSYSAQDVLSYLMDRTQDG